MKTIAHTHSQLADALRATLRAIFDVVRPRDDAAQIAAVVAAAGQPSGARASVSGPAAPADQGCPGFRLARDGGSASAPASWRIKVTACVVAALLLSSGYAA